MIDLTHLDFDPSMYLLDTDKFVNIIYTLGEPDMFSLEQLPYSVARAGAGNSLVAMLPAGSPIDKIYLKAGEEDISQTILAAMMARAIYDAGPDAIYGQDLMNMIESMLFTPYEEHPALEDASYTVSSWARLYAALSIVDTSEDDLYTSARLEDGDYINGRNVIIRPYSQSVVDTLDPHYWQTDCTYQIEYIGQNVKNYVRLNDSDTHVDISKSLHDENIYCVNGAVSWMEITGKQLARIRELNSLTPRQIIKKTANLMKADGAIDEKTRQGISIMCRRMLN